MDRQLRMLMHEIETRHADLLELLARFIEETLFAEEQVERATGDAENAPARPIAIQRRADALSAMANASVAVGDASLRSSPRPQVVVTIDADVLAEDAPALHDHPAGCACRPPQVDLPLPVRAVIQGSGGITAATAQRIACDADIVTIITSGGEPLSIGRKQRAWPASMVRAITARDEGCCQFPGCDSTRFLQVHHLVHWAHGGETSVRNGCLLCSDCHRRVHEEHWRIIRDDERPGARHAETTEGAELLNGACERTHEVARRLSRHRPRLRFERARRWPRMLAGYLDARESSRPDGSSLPVSGRGSERVSHQIPSSHPACPDP